MVDNRYFPLIYSNGDSYSDQNFQAVMQGRVYADYVGQHLSGYVLNRARSGSCNQRIIRLSTHDVIHQRRINPDQPIIALIQLSFELRDEVWLDAPKTNRDEAESNFREYDFAGSIDWRQRLLKKLPFVNTFQLRDFDNVNQHYLDKWAQGRAFFYSAYAERIKLLQSVLALTSIFEQHNVQYLIFAGPRYETLVSEYLIDFFKSCVDPARVLDFETFAFCDWCNQRGFDPIIKDEPRDIGHYGPEAHEAFAAEVLIPRLERNAPV